MAMRSSGALPKVTLSKPPTVLPSLCDASSVPRRMYSESGMIAPMPAANTQTGARWR